MLSAAGLGLTLCLTVSCKKRQVNPEANPAKLFTPTFELKHKWYYLTADSIEPVDLPQNAPDTIMTPWTESIRISSARSTSGADGVNTGYGLVNRAGIIVFSADTPDFHAEKTLLAGNTAGQLMLKDDIPLFTLYKSTFFNTAQPQAAQPKSMRPFLVQYRADSSTFYPLISYENLSLPENSEITGYVWDGLAFYCSVKQNKPERVLFSYLKISATQPLLTLTPHTSKTALELKTISTDDFRKIQEPLPFNKAPAQIRELLEHLDPDLYFTLDYATFDGTTPVHILHGTDSSIPTDLSASAYIAGTWTAIVFNDGTVYLSGALHNRPALANGKAVSFRLPKLPAGFVYGDFVLSESTLYTAWEESDFYKTGRSGFIQVDLDKLLYRPVAE